MSETKIHLTIIVIAFVIISLVTGIISFRKFWLVIESDPIASALRSESTRLEKQEILEVVEKYDTPPVDIADRLALDNRSYQKKTLVTLHNASGTAKLGSWYNYDCLTPNDCKTTYCTRDKLENHECYSQLNQTCASHDYPRGTLLKVTNIQNQHWILCRCNDVIENPDVDIDLSQKSFEWLANLSEGIIKVNIEKL